MSDCQSCGARVSPGEHFCGNCGSQLLLSSPEFKTVAPDSGDKDNLPVREGREWATTLDPSDETPIRIEQAVPSASAELHRTAEPETREPSGSL
jgi:hypothetical protein